jgi:L-iditol 2-dehydrogenase
MKAVVNVAQGPGQLQFKDIPDSVPQPGEVKIAIKAAGICGSDLNTYYRGEYPTSVPVVLGHEIGGEVVEVSDDVDRIAIGDRVTAISSVKICGQCQYCLNGEWSLCLDRLAFGTHVNGGFAEFIAVPERVVRRLPDNVSYDEAVLAEPLACCVKATIFLTAILPGDIVLISGPGTLGLLSLQLAKLQGAKVILTGIAADAYRLRVGQELGADVIAQADAEDVDQVVRDISDGRGVDVVLECSGAPSAIKTGLVALRKQGQFTQLGLSGKPFELDFQQVVMKELHVVGSCATSVRSWSRSLQLLGDGLVNVRPLASAGLPLEEFVQAFAMARDREGIKSIFHPEA